MKPFIKVIGTLFALYFASFAQAETLSEALQSCSRIDNSLKRLVCFDKLTQRANGMQDMDLPESVARQGNSNNYSAAPQAPRASAEDQFGIVETRKEQLSEIVAVVAKVQENAVGHLTVTLDNGQVWKHSTGPALNLLKEGETVIISTGLLGSYYMAEQGKNKRMLVRRSQ